MASRSEQRLVVVGHRTLFAYLLCLDFAPAEVIELQLWPPAADAGEGRAAAQAAEGWSWGEARGAEEILPLYNWKDEPLCSQGSPPLRGTLSTCRLNRGDEAARHTARRAGRAPPLCIPGLHW
uniref:Uncharacterized protein n=1 Tax=Pyrodinium bahamense TaxID=73915 RepID=A0A7R9ZXC3_9DINO